MTSESETLRARAQSIVLTFEREFGQILKERFEVSDEELASSFLMDLFGIALQRAAEKSEIDSWRAVQDLASRATLPEIRNAVCHPNRPFPEVYWYRLGSFATDPLLDGVGFKGTMRAFRLASEGRLEAPSEDWICRPAEGIPTNLPSDADFLSTGLIGRTQELSELRRYLFNRRIPMISIVASGGMGKTALLIQLLQSATKDTQCFAHIDAVVWVSAKSELLTVDGVKQLDAAQTLEEVEARAFGVITQLAQSSGLPALAEGRVLLAIDNLENVLRDNFEGFRNFQLALPKDWQVVVTSRIHVPDGVVFSLGPLNPAASKDLFRRYAVARGLPKPSENMVNNACILGDGNPLALRLTVERLLFGQTLQEAGSRAQVDVAEFAFASLLEGLTDLERRVVASGAIIEEFSRLEVQRILNAELDAVSDGLGRLVEIGILRRVVNDQGITQFALANAILPIVSKVLSPELLKSTVNRIRKVRAKNEPGRPSDISERSKSDYLSFGDQYSVEARRTLEDASSLLGSVRLSQLGREGIASLRRRLETAQGDYPSSPDFARFLAEVCIAGSDRQGYVNNLARAVALSQSDDLRCTWQAAFHLSLNNEFQRAAEKLKLLWEARWHDPSMTDPVTAARVLVHGTKAFRNCAQQDFVLLHTDAWLASDELRRLWGPSRIYCIVDQMQKASRGPEWNEVVHRCVSAVLGAWGQEEIGSKPLLNATSYAVRSGATAAYAAAVLDNGTLDAIGTALSELLAMCAKFLPRSIEAGVTPPDEGLKVVYGLAAIDLEGNPFLDIDLSSLTPDSSPEEGWEEVRIKRRPRKRDVIVVETATGVEAVGFLRGWRSDALRWHRLKVGETIDAVLLPPKDSRHVIQWARPVS